MKDIIKTKDAKKGGYLVGKPHSQGGIKGINVDTNEPIEVEGGEVVITKPAVESQKTYELDGVPMKPRDILSKINSDHGGVKFKDGGEIDSKFDDGGKIPLNPMERQEVNKSRFIKAMVLSSIGKEGIVFSVNRAIDVLIKEIDYEDGKYLAKCQRKSESDTYSGLAGSYDLDSIVQINDFVYLNPTNTQFKDLPGFYGGDYLLADPKTIDLQSDVYRDPAPFVPYAVLHILTIKNKRILYLFKYYIDEEGNVKEYNCFYAYEPIEEDIFEDVRKETGKENLPFIKYNEAEIILIKNYGNNRIPFKDLPETKKGRVNLYPPTKNEIVLEDSQYFGQIGFTMSQDMGLLQKKNLLFYNYTNFTTPNNLVYQNSNGGIVRYKESERFITQTTVVENFKKTPLFVGDNVLLLIKDSSINPTIHTAENLIVDYKDYYAPQGYRLSDFDYFATVDSGLKISTKSDGKVYSKSIIGEIVGFKINNRTSPFSAAESVFWSVVTIFLTTSDNNIYAINLNDFYLMMVYFGKNPMRSICPAYEDGGEMESAPQVEPTTIDLQSLSETMILLAKKKDETDALKYELLLEALDDEETKLVVLRAINKDNPVKIRDIDRRLDEIARKRGEYQLKMNTSLELLDKFEQIIDLPKSTDEEPTGESITGEASELTEYQRNVVNSPNFKNWFGDWITAYELDDYNGVSKAVSPITREPLVLYHGTGDDFTNFTFDKFPVAYFADNWSYSQWFAMQKGRGGGGQIYEVFISMKNPINLQSFGLNLVTMEEILNYIEQNYKIGRYKIFPQLEQLSKNPQKMFQAMNLRLQVWQFVRRSVNFIKYLKEETFYDGILMFEDNPQDLLEGNKPNSTGSYVVFFTSQIKWANAKFYNPYIDDNRFKHGGLINYFSKQRK